MRPLDKAEVLLETKIDALDITILKGGGDAVGKWAIDHGFLLTPDAPEVLDFYAQRSPIFMAARFDATRAPRARPERTATARRSCSRSRPTSPWVPLRILGLGLDADARSSTPTCSCSPTTSPSCSPAARPRRSSAASRRPSSLLDDLRSDKGMEWVPDDMWLTYLRVDTPAGDLDYDLAVSTRAGELPSARMVGHRPHRRPAPSPRAARRRGTPRHRRRRARALAVRRRRRSGSGAASGRGGRERRVRRRVRRSVAARSRACSRSRVVGVFAVGVHVGGASGDDGPRVLGPGTGDREAGRRSTAASRRHAIRVRPHTDVTFEIVNHDLIGHEFIIGDDEVHARHEGGARPYHPPMPGEVSIATARDRRRRPTRSTRPGRALRVPPPGARRVRHDGLRDRRSGLSDRFAAPPAATGVSRPRYTRSADATSLVSDDDVKVSSPSGVASTTTTSPSR